jgi:glycosyltransferase involved in cell wall biosynthesis
VTNGVDLGRFGAAPDPATITALRTRVGAPDRFLILAVGGVEPRKGSDHLFRAMSLLRTRMSPPPLLAIIGGHSFQDHGPYRERVLGSMSDLGLEFGRDIVLLGTLPDDEMAPWYHAADALAFPSVNEGFGLTILEAMAAGTPTVVSTLPVFQEYLSFGRDTLAVDIGDNDGLATALMSLANDAALRDRLIAAGRTVASGFGWDRTAAQHIDVYRRLGST